MQAILLLFLITPIGVLGSLGMFSDGKYAMGVLFVILTVGAAALGIWLLRSNPPRPPEKNSGPPPIIGRRR
jgi:hypothetical protein